MTTEPLTAVGAIGERSKTEIAPTNGGDECAFNGERLRLCQPGADDYCRQLAATSADDAPQVDVFRFLIGSRGSVAFAFADIARRAIRPKANVDVKKAHRLILHSIARIYSKTRNISTFCGMAV